MQTELFDVCRSQLALHAACKVSTLPLAGFVSRLRLFEIFVSFVSCELAKLCACIA